MRKNIMIQGTSSSVGKSILAAAICRILTEDGYSVAPFKSQNMSLNSHVTGDGHEMGRAQVLQAEASRIPPHVNMNPILLKPVADEMSQVIVMGKVLSDMKASNYFLYKPRLREIIMTAYNTLADASDVVVIEGAGSPAEINLNADDIVNMGLAEMVDAPVILVADIDRGGVFASIYGTVMLLQEHERKRIRGIIINKFRGDKSLLLSGLTQIEELVGIKVLGVIPYFHLDLDDEDSVVDWRKFSRNPEGALDIAVMRLPHLSNFTDFNPLWIHKDVNLRFVDLDDELGQPDLIIIPGTKSTVSDLLQMKRLGMDRKILQCHAEGTAVMGICGGYQILGQTIRDPHQVESDLTEVNGLGIIDMETTFGREKNTALIEGVEHLSGTGIKGYEIHMGDSVHRKEQRPLVTISRSNSKVVSLKQEGILLKDAGVMGTYVHGIFDNAGFTREVINYLLERKGMDATDEQGMDFWQHKDEQLTALARLVRENLDMEAFYAVLHES